MQGLIDLVSRVELGIQPGSKPPAQPVCDCAQHHERLSAYPTTPEFARHVAHLEDFKKTTGHYPACPDSLWSRIQRSVTAPIVVFVPKRKEACEVSLSYGYDPTGENGTPCGADGTYCEKCEVVHCRQHGEC